MESLESQPGEPRHGAAHLCARRGFGNFASAGAIQVKEEDFAASGGRDGGGGCRGGPKIKAFFFIIFRAVKGFRKLPPQSKSVPLSPFHPGSFAGHPRKP